MQTNLYREAKQSLVNNARHGWKYIDFFILSPQMFEALLQEKDTLKGGRRVLLEEGERISYKGVFINGSVFGYPVMVCKGFDEPYGVVCVQFQQAHEARHQHYIERNISDTINGSLN
jgi:hypothetical protein